ncbi:MAG: 4-hydroxyphenylacetate 3-hydroxylase N-terminal domain-containing protein [Gaiellaceae bacterium]
MTQLADEQTFVKGAEEYLASMRDGRQVFYQGEAIEDVTTHAATGRGVATIADLFEDQRRPETRDLLSYTRDDGARVTASYFLPQTKADLAWRREGIEYVARKTFGMFGRGVDMISTSIIGYVSELPTFKRECPDFAENITAYRTVAEENNIHLGATIVDPQGYRARASGTADTEAAPERATLTIVKEDSSGIWISGVKGVGTAVPQANEIVVGGFHPPRDEESFWVIVPCNAEGIRMYCREMVHDPNSVARNHPLDVKGEEIEAIVAFDEVFVPRERIISMKTKAVHGVNFYNVMARHEHWYTFVRTTARAELLAGLAQLVVDTLELGEIPLVRQRVAKIFRWAAACRAMIIAPKEMADFSEGGVMTPDASMISAGRAYALDLYPEIVHTIRDICGQGMIFRFDDRDLESPAAFEKNLGWFLDTRSVSARDKNMVMNLVWDAVGSSHAMRVELFEESNALNVPFLLERVYNEYDRSQAIADCRAVIGLGEGEEKDYVHEIEQTWSERKKRGDY